MSQEVRHAALKEKTQQLLEGPLKHIRGAALAAALLPLASIAATPASAQTACPSSAGTCIGGFVWNDINHDGIQNDGDTAFIEGAKVFACVNGTNCDVNTDLSTESGPDGFYYFEVPPGSYTIYVQISGELTGKQASEPNVGDDTLDSDGVPINGFSVAENVVLSNVSNFDTDFGFVSVAQPGTGTPGYWKNHPDAWPVTSITIGGQTYTREQAISFLAKVGKDKTMTMFSSLVSARLNVMIGNDSSCVAGYIAAADSWMATVGLGSNLAASSPAWATGEPLHQWMDAYNNGLKCAPHRN